MEAKTPAPGEWIRGPGQPSLRCRLRIGHAAGSPAKLPQSRPESKRALFGASVDQHLVLGVERMEVRWSMIAPEHLNQDSVECAIKISIQYYLSATIKSGFIIV